jgi:glyoxylase-like metal-dependent hydrolase (beta-lactamase superfamily II)
MSSPGALPDLAEGPACVPGVPVSLGQVVARVTAPNPSMMTGPGTNTYVVGEHDGDVVVIDPGPDLVGHRDVVTAVIDGRRVSAVAVTHHHLDHAPGARALADEVGAPVVGYGHAEFDVDVAAREGTELVAGAVRLVAWYTPGHASDHLCFFEPSMGWLFTGDHLMEGSTVVIGPPDGDLTEYLANVARVRDDGRVTKLVPGHGRVLADPRLAAGAVLDHRARRTELVEAALREHGPGTAASLRPFAYRDVGPERDAVATAQCWAHLLALVDARRATSSVDRRDPEAVFAALRDDA